MYLIVLLTHVPARYVSKASPSRNAIYLPFTDLTVFMIIMFLAIDGDIGSPSYPLIPILPNTFTKIILKVT